jgi:mRNA-degrading endonuclease RelE of RelBE toxin-antitoxin system
MGAVIPESGGLRKLRWVSAGKGKRGGLRVIYYWVTNDHKILLLYVYSKAKQEDLTSQELKFLKTLIEE